MVEVLLTFVNRTCAANQPGWSYDGVTYLPL